MKGMNMSNSLKNKVAVVTGGTSEIGKAAALALAEVGAKVVVAGRHEKERHAIVDAIEKFGGNDFILPGRCDETRFIVPINVFKAIEFPVKVRHKRSTSAPLSFGRNRTRAIYHRDICSRQFRSANADHDRFFDRGRS